MRKYATTWLLVISIFIAESHSYLGRYSEIRQNWIFTVDRTMEMQWNVKLLSDQINAIIYFFAMYFYIPNRKNKATVISFIILCFVDLLMYFHNYKTLYYGSVYVWISLLWLGIYYRYTVKKETITLWKKIKTHIRSR